MRLSAYCIAITSRNAGSIYSGLLVSAIWRALLRSGSSIHTCSTTRSGTRSEIATTPSGWGERNYSSRNALPIPTGTTGTCVHLQVISWSKRHRGNILACALPVIVLPDDAPGIKVIRRNPLPFQQSPENPTYLLRFKEELRVRVQGYRIGAQHHVQRGR